MEDDSIVESSAESSISIEEKGNLTFIKNVAIPELNDFSYRFFDSLKNSDMDVLLIKGYHLIGENEELGIERAKNTKETLLKQGFKIPIEIQKGFKQMSPNGKFNALEFIPLSEVSNQEEEENNDFEVEKLKDKLVIYFPVASADPHTNSQLTEELKEFASIIQKSGKDISITGHTDNSGTHEVNIHYGLLRANAIKNLIIEYGLSTKNIKVYSKGESEPIADNTSHSGKRKNRRVEVKILNDQ